MQAGLIGLCCAAALIGVATPAQAAKVRRSANATGVGVNGLLDPLGRKRPIAAAHVAHMAASGISMGRTDAFWSWVEPTAPVGGRHRFNWSKPDDVARLLAADGIRWLPILDYATYWSESVPGNEKSPPATDEDYASYAQAFAERYGRGGSFWAENPELPELPVTAYEIWNEPNLSFFWQPTPDPARYASLYAAARPAIKAVDPKAIVIVGGLAPYADGYVRDMYEARPELEGKVDAVAYHPYGPDAELLLRLVRKMRSTLDDLGEDDVPIWITEFGWPTQGTGGLSAEALPDATRAANLALVSDAMLGSNCDIEALTPYTWATPERDPEHDEQWLGIFHPDTSPTEAGNAYLAVIERNAKAADDDPRLALELCRNRGTRFAKPLRLKVTVAPADAGCRTARVTYRGRPLNAVTVRFGDARAESDADGVARSCAKGEVTARVLDVASG